MNERYRAYDPTPDEYALNEDELASNSSPRVPIVICVDCSFSMKQRNSTTGQSRIEAVQEGIDGFIRDMCQDPVAKDTVELCVIAAGGSEAAEATHDMNIINKVKLDRLNADGETPLVAGVDLALEKIKERIRKYEDTIGRSNYYRPWLIIIGDGDDSGPQEYLQRTAARLKEEYAAKHLSVMCIMVGDDSLTRDGMNTLRKLSPDGKVHYLRELKFKEFFGWLSRSVQRTGQSVPAGTEAEFMPTGTWDEDL